jgi:hypothetical protein
MVRLTRDALADLLKSKLTGACRIVILVTFFIYIRAGREIYKKHKNLRDFSSHHEPEPLPPMEDPFSSSKTTEVFVTTEVVDKNEIDLAPLGRRGSESTTTAPKPPNAAYSVTISASTRANIRQSVGEITAPVQETVTIVNPTQSRGNNANPLRRRAAYEANNAAWSYTKCALLFFTAMLVTWIPSSANRVYSVVHTNEVSTPLEYMSAFVLPLQGFWNALIYIVTSWKACKGLFDGAIPVSLPKRRSVTELVNYRQDNKNFQMMSSGRNSDKGSHKSESDSILELAHSVGRPSTHERSGI